MVDKELNNLEDPAIDVSVIKPGNIKFKTVTVRGFGGGWGLELEGFHSSIEDTFTSNERKRGPIVEIALQHGRQKVQSNIP